MCFCCLSAEFPFLPVPGSGALNRRISEDSEQLAVGGQSAFGLLREDLLREDLAQLDALLVEAVDIPDKALEHDLVLEMRKDGAECFRSQLVADDDAGGTSALEILVPVFIVLAAGKGHDLRRDVRAELLLAGAVLDDHIVRHLALLKADELDRDDAGALVQELVDIWLFLKPTNWIGTMPVPWCRSW